MNEDITRRIREVAEYLEIEAKGAWTLSEAARAFGCDEAYLIAEPELPPSAVTALARMGANLSHEDREEARRFAAYLAHATDD